MAAAGPENRAGLVFALSVLLHAFLLVGLTFVAPKFRMSDFKPPLEVVLVNAKTRSAPVEAGALAQANLDHGGNTDAERQAKSPLPVVDQVNPRTAETALEERQQQVRRLEQETQRLMTQAQSKTAVETPVERTPPERTEETPHSTEMVRRSLEAARLEAQISRDWDAYQKRPRREMVGARTREYLFARYVEDWRVKVERVGNLNYPEAAKRDRLYGQLLLTVSIRADGSIETVEINRSSGHRVLDQAAMRIVQMAGPYAPFPEDMRKRVDILSITRTWTFTRADQLTSE